MWHMNEMGYYCVLRNVKYDGFKETSKDTHELAQSEIRRIRRITNTITSITKRKTTLKGFRTVVNAVNAETSWFPKTNDKACLPPRGGEIMN